MTRHRAHSWLRHATVRRAEVVQLQWKRSNKVASRDSLSLTVNLPCREFGVPSTAESASPINPPTAKEAGDSATRIRILEAAARCYEEYSVARTSVEDIAKAAKLSRPTLYRHFANRDEIALAALTMKSAEISRRVTERLATCVNSRDRIATAMMVSIEFLINDRQTRESLGGPFLVAIAKSGGPGVGVLDSLTERWIPILHAGIADGTLRAGLDMSATISWLADMQMLMAVRILAVGESLDDMRCYIDQFVLDGISRRT